MKKIIILASAVAILLLACKKEVKDAALQNGELSFSEFSLSQDDYVETKAAVSADGSYAIIISNAEGDVVLSTTYSNVKSNNDKVSLPAGNYTLVARSSEQDVPVSAFEQPVYGTQKEFTIAAGEVTSIGSLTCTLLQCKVSVSYSDDFLSMVTGNGNASVEVTAGYPLNYALTYENGSVKYDQNAGYFYVRNDQPTTLAVTFKGLIEGKSQKMTKTITGIQQRQWRQIKFIKKVNETGDATFDIVINDFISDSELNNSLVAEEEVIGEDPQAPKGDGGIDLTFDYDAGCDAEFTDLQNVVIPPLDQRAISLKLKAAVPNGVAKFTVDIASTSSSFVNAVEAAQATHIDLIHPIPANDIIFQVVPFPHGEELLGQTNIAFDMSAAQEAIINYPGTHTFTMNVTDTQGCKKSISIVMVVE